MPDAYCTGMLACHNKEQAANFKLFVETSNRLELTDADCREVVDDLYVKKQEVEDGPKLAGGPTLLALADVADVKGDSRAENGHTLFTDAEREVCKGVLLNLPLSISSKRVRPPIVVDMPTCVFDVEGLSVDPEHATSISIYFDGHSHQSKKTHIWVWLQFLLAAQALLLKSYIFSKMGFRTQTLFFSSINRSGTHFPLNERCCKRPPK